MAQEMKTPEQVAQDTLHLHSILPHWRRNGEQIANLIAEAIEADRAQRPALEQWEIISDQYPHDVHRYVFTCDYVAATQIASSWGGGVEGETFSARKIGA